MQTEVMSLDLTDAQFAKIAELTYRICGINLHSGKETLVQSRLAKRLRALNIGTFQEYMQYLENDKSGAELATMIDSLTTNKTFFFRESQHFDYLISHAIAKQLDNGENIKIWCAGCSSGQEPYTIGISIKETSSKSNTRILATDISARMLTAAKQAEYPHSGMQDVSASLLSKYFTQIGARAERTYRVNDEIKSMIRFGRLNLMDPWPMKGPFDAIFCRNVMIYFDKPTQERLIMRFWEKLRPGGHLFVGHSESLTSIAHKFEYAKPAVYVK